MINGTEVQSNIHWHQNVSGILPKGLFLKTFEIQVHFHLHSGFINLFITALEWSVWERWDLIFSQLRMVAISLPCLGLRNRGLGILFHNQSRLQLCGHVPNNGLILVPLCTCCRAVSSCKGGPMPRDHCFGKLVGHSKPSKTSIQKHQFCAVQEEKRLDVYKSLTFSGLTFPKFTPAIQNR